MKPPALAFLLTILGPSLALAQAPAGAEFRVNSFTVLHQYFPAAAFDCEGDFVVVWSTDRGSSEEVGVAAQRYTAGGQRVGAEFMVNTTVLGLQYANQLGTPIAMRPDGRFVVVWSHSVPGTGQIFGQRFEADGTKAGGEFAVSTAPDGSYYANVAIAPHGTFVVVWARNTLSPNPDVYARIFDAGGNGVGAPFRVHAATTGIQTVPRVAMDRSGAFVVVWQDRSGRDGDGHGVFAQRFDPAGQRLGAEFQVNTYTTGNQYAYSVSRTPDGRFVVAWDSSGDGDGFGVFASRYEADGTPIGSAFQVNSATAGSQSYGAVATDHQFRLATGWQSTTGDGSGFAIRARTFDEQGAPRGAEFRANSFTTLSQQAANVAVDEVGNLLVLWQSDRQDGSDLGVFAQRYGGLHPRALRIGPSGNGVLEPGEAEGVMPTWANTTGAAVIFPAELIDPAGPPGGVPVIFQPSATYNVQNGQSGECAVCYAVAIPDPTPRPALHWDVTALETIVPAAQGQRKRWTLHVGASFTDVALASPFYPFIETLLHHGITGGCTATSYCPASPTTREQMAVFVLVAKEGTGYAPPACTTPAFPDVPASSPFCRWIEELARRGVVAGCGGGNYCPGSPVSRQEMAVFALRTYEPTRIPPACAPPNLFADVPETSGFCRWIEELARRGVVGGCGGGNYCPVANVTRDQMGVFISGTFELALYGV